MATYLLTWNPTVYDWDADGYAEAVEDTAQGLLVRESWSTGNRKKDLAPGDRGFLVRQYEQRGIVASGTFTSDIFQDLHFNGSGEEINYAKISFDTVLAPEDRLPVEMLLSEIPGVAWDNLQASGIEARGADADALADLWAGHTGTVAWHSPEEEFAQQYAEGRPTQVWVNRYERNPKARRACIAHHGTTCVVCGLNFEVMYGRKGKGFIHVHHLDPLGSLQKAHMVDPVRDLRPVCPNCHSMLHTSKPPLDVKVLKREVTARRRVTKKSSVL